MNSLINELLEKFSTLTREERDRMASNNFDLFEALEKIEDSCKYYQSVRKEQLKNK